MFMQKNMLLALLATPVADAVRISGPSGNYSEVNGRIQSIQSTHSYSIGWRMDQMHTCGGNTAWQSYSKAYQLNLTFTFTNEETISGLEFVQYASYDLSSGRYKITNVTMFAGETRHAQEQPNSGAWIVTFPVVTAQVFTLELHSDSEGKFVLDCVKFRFAKPIPPKESTMTQRPKLPPEVPVQHGEISKGDRDGEPSPPKSSSAAPAPSSAAPASPQASTTGSPAGTRVPNTPATAEPNADKASSLSTAAWLGILLPAGGVIILFVCSVLAYLRYQKQDDGKTEIPIPPPLLPPPPPPPQRKNPKQAAKKLIAQSPLTSGYLYAYAQTQFKSGDSIHSPRQR